MIEIRALSPDDWAAWRELRLRALAEAPYAFGSKLSDWQGDGDREPRWRGRLEIAGSHNLVAVLDGEPVGMASGVPGERDGEAEMISMWVSPKARGRGVGDRLVGAVVEWARAGGARAVTLAVSEGNAAATALYRRHGFVDTGERQDMPDGVRQEWIMRLKLT